MTNTTLYTQAHEYFLNTLRHGSYTGDGWYKRDGIIHYGGDMRMLSYFQHECEIVDNILNGNLTSRAHYSYREMLRETECEVTPFMVKRCINALKAYTHTVYGYFIPNINQLGIDEVLDIYQASVDASQQVREEKGLNVLS